MSIFQIQGNAMYKKTGILLPNLMKSQSHEIECYNDHITLKFGRHLSSSGACQILEQSETSKPKYHGFKTEWDHAVRRPST